MAAWWETLHSGGRFHAKAGARRPSNATKLLARLWGKGPEDVRPKLRTQRLVRACVRALISLTNSGASGGVSRALFVMHVRFR